MMELWRYTYNYVGRWYEAYCYLSLGLEVEEAHRKILGTLDPSVRGLQVRQLGHVTAVAGCGPYKRIPASYAIR